MNAVKVPTKLFRKLRKVPLREDLMMLTKDLNQSLVLGQMLYWTERIDDLNDLILEENKRLAEHDQPQVEYNYGWIWKSARQMSEELFFALGEDTVQRAFAGLLSRGLLTKRRNPKFKYDRTVQYRVDLIVLRRMLKDIGVEFLDFQLEPQPQNAECIPQIAEWKTQIAESIPQNALTIPEITIESIIENTSESIPPSDFQPTENPQCGKSAPLAKSKPSVASKETPPAGAAKRPSPDCAAPLPELEANKTKVNQMFRRRDNTVWSDKERKALENTLGTTEEEWETLIEYYSHAGEEGYYCRTAPLTAMNNWAGEIDKAKLDRKKKSAKSPTSSETNKLAGGIAGREDEFWAWVHSKRPWEERRPTRAVPEEWVWDFLNGTKDEDLF
jgi:hypothetical protein